MHDYPTVVNNIPKSKKTYTSSPADFAKVDNGLASSQLSIGESSNLAQLCLTYTYSFAETRSEYEDYCTILAVIAQASIDSAKRSFDIDIPSEIKRIKTAINVKENGYPKFWKYVRPDLANKINASLQCPMNEVCETKFFASKNRDDCIPFADFIVNKQPPANRKVSRRIEELINKFAWMNYQLKFDEDMDDYDTYLLLQKDFELMINEIKTIAMGKKYAEIFYWLINRAFVLTPQAQAKTGEMQTTISKNKSLLMKTLYDINPDLFLEQFKNVEKCEKTGQQ